jgi:hypothetical protein
VLYKHFWQVKSKDSNLPSQIIRQKLPAHWPATFQIPCKNPCKHPGGCNERTRRTACRSFMYIHSNNRTPWQKFFGSLNEIFPMQCCDTLELSVWATLKSECQQMPTGIRRDQIGKHPMPSLIARCLDSTICSTVAHQNHDLLATWSVATLISWLIIQSPEHHAARVLFCRDTRGKGDARAEWHYIQHDRNPRDRAAGRWDMTHTIEKVKRRWSQPCRAKLITSQVRGRRWVRTGRNWITLRVGRSALAESDTQEQWFAGFIRAATVCAMWCQCTRGLLRHFLRQQMDDSTGAHLQFVSRVKYVSAS